MALLVKCFPWGSLVRLTAVFTDALGMPVDPDSVTVRTDSPDLTLAAKVYVMDIEVVRDDVGKYHFDVDASVPGDWNYRWEGTGIGQAAAEGKFKVAGSVFRGGSP
jgi:hypothetical protein